jgi:hypothetical protein
MSTRELKDSFHNVFNNHTGTSPHEIRRVFEEAMREWEIERGWDESNTHHSWTDDELRVVLSDAPTKENCLKHARAFKRGYGAIEQIYRWAATTRSEIDEKRPDDAFIKQIKRVARRLGWRA